MTGTLQTHARKYNLPIDTLSFQFKVVQGKYIQPGDPVPAKYLDPVEDGVLVHGVFMDGKFWSATMVRPPSPFTCSW